MIYFQLADFPKFKEEYRNDGCDTWLESLLNAGYHSAVRDIDSSWFVVGMEDKEFTMFLLRWS